MAKIRINTLGVVSLRQNTRTLKNKANDCVQTIAYVRNNIDMNTASAENIQSRLQALQKRMQVQEDKLAWYTSFLEKVNDDFAASDRKIANQSKKVRYLLDQIINRSLFFRTRETLRLREGLTEYLALAGLFGLGAAGSLASSRYLPVSIVGLFGHESSSTGENHVPGSYGAGSTIDVAATNLPSEEKPGLWDKIKGTASGAWDWTKGAAAKTWDWTKDTAAKTWDAVKEEASNTWENTKYLVNSKPVKYLYETGKDTLSATCEVFSFVRNVATGKWVSAATNVYKAADGVINIGQDLTATVLHTAGACFNVFGAGKAAKLLYEEAASYAKRDGIAGELESAGADGFAKTVRWIDVGADTVGLFSTAQKLDEARIAYFSAEEGSTFKFIKAMASAGGVKLDLSLGSSLSNLKSGIKITEGALSDGFWDSIAQNSPIGKPFVSLGKIIKKSTDNLK